jgi:hypothetical protein
MLRLLYRTTEIPRDTWQDGEGLSAKTINLIRQAIRGQDRPGSRLGEGPPDYLDWPVIINDGTKQLIANYALSKDYIGHTLLLRVSAERLATQAVILRLEVYQVMATTDLRMAEPGPIAEGRAGNIVDDIMDRTKRVPELKVE